MFLWILEREERRREREEHQWAASCTPPTGYGAQNLDMGPAWKLNQQPFGTWDTAQPTEPHWQGNMCCLNLAYFTQLKKKI